MPHGISIGSIHSAQYAQVLSCSGETVTESDGIIQIDSSKSAALKKAKYGISDHGTVGLCHWTKKSVRHEGVCYKHTFYGISTHQCMEFSPAGMHCQNRCVYCWRPVEFYDSMSMDPKRVASPQEIMRGLYAERRRLLMGHYGDQSADKALLDESQTPSHYAISLSGEPTMYPRLPELIRYLKSLAATKSVFLVTNGQEPDMIRRLADEDALPTQLYLSANAADRGSFMRINRPRYEDSWERWNTTMEMLSGLDTRTVIRITLIKNHNTDPEMRTAFAAMLDTAGAHFVEVKSYMHIGRSTGRLERQNMVDMHEVREFAADMAARTAFAYMDEVERSRIVVIQNGRRMINPVIEAYA